MRLLPFVTCCLLLTAASALATPETAVLHPLAVTPTPALTEPVEALQRRFLSIARDRSGYELLLRKEVEEALKAAGRKDYARSDDALASLANTAKVELGLYVTFELTAQNELVLQGRVVRRTGERVRAATLTVPRGGGSLLDALGTAAERFFEQLNRPPPPSPEPAVAAPVLPQPPAAAPLEPAPAAPVVAQQPAATTSPLPVIGYVVAGVGAATAITGGIVFATSGVVQRDADGNIAVADAPRVAGIRAQQGAGVALLASGGAVAVAGVVLALVAPRAPVTASLTPSADGAFFTVAGSF